jgi:hypothetical protein
MMDNHMARLIMDSYTATPMQKWVVTKRTQTRRTRGDNGEWMSAGETFHGEWIVLGWLKIQERNRWIKVSDCDKIPSVEPPDTPPSPTGDVLRWIRSDFELLGTKYERRRSLLSGSPQTVVLGCKENDSVKSTTAYIDLTLALNPGMTFENLASTMNSWVRQSEKWSSLGGRVPTKLIFACNTIAIIDLSMCSGGLTGIPSGTWIYRLDTLPYDALENYSASNLPQKYIMHFTNTVHGSAIVNPSPAMGGRNGYPVRFPITSRYPVYIKQVLTKPAITFRNPYNPEWLYT